MEVGGESAGRNMDRDNRVQHDVEKKSRKRCRTIMVTSDFSIPRLWLATQGVRHFRHWGDGDIADEYTP